MRAAYYHGAVIAPLLLLAACDARTPPQLLSAGLAAAASGDPASWDLCQRLELGEGRGVCKVAASRTLAPERRFAACDDFSRERWRDECWFVLAEDEVTAGHWDAAIAACGESAGYRVDCGRHLLWQMALVESPPADLAGKLGAAFPEAAAAPPAEDAIRTHDAEISRALATDVREDRAAQDAESTRGDFEALFRSKAHISLAPCPTEDRGPCMAAAAAVLTERLRRSVARNDRQRAALCGGGQGGRLTWDAEPALEAAVEDLRTKVCDR